jgi:hypothetical protein
MRAQGRAITALELWSLARGSDLRGTVDFEVSVGKLFGIYAPLNIVGPDPFYKMQILKDEAKNNKVKRSELIGATRHRDPLLCAINAVASVLLLRFGHGGIIGALPEMFDKHHNWPRRNQLFTGPEGTGAFSYDDHVKLFADMKTAAGLQMELGGNATKLRCFGAMAAYDYQASHPEIEKCGRCSAPHLNPTHTTELAYPPALRYAITLRYATLRYATLIMYLLSFPCCLDGVQVAKTREKAVWS